MKPVIKKQTHYNLLLMKDDSPARTLRVHSTTLKVLLTLFVLLLLAGGGGIAGGVHFFKEYLQLVAQNEAQDKELSEMRLQLERLVNLECLIVASNGSVPLAKNEEVGASAPPARQAGEGEHNGQNGSQEGGRPDNGATETPGAAGGASDGSAATPPDDQTSSQTSSQTGDQPNGMAGGAPGGQDAHSQAGGATGSGHLSLDAEDSPLRINGFNVRVSGRERLRISYELSTTPSDEPRTVSGSVRYRALLKDGAGVDLTSYDIEGTRFAIARMKPMASSARMPQGYLTENVDKIEVLVELADGTMYQDIFSLDEQ